MKVLTTCWWRCWALALWLAAVSQGHATPMDTVSVARVQLEHPAEAAKAPERALLLSIARAGQRLIAVGEHGVITVSDDGGQRWRAVPSGVAAALTQVRFADARTGWAVGHFGIVLHSSDGGMSWQRRLDGVQSAALALKQRSASSDAGRAMQATQRLVDDGPDKPLLDVLVDANRVLVVGAFNTAYRSDDAGRQWTDVAPLAANARDLHLYGATLAAGKLWLVGESGLVLAGAPDAREFTRVPMPYQGSLSGVLALSGQAVLVHGLRGNVFVTGDGGANWKAAKLPTDTIATTVNCSVLLQDGRIALGNQAGDLLVSADQGQSFAPLHRVGIPITGIAQAADGALVLTTYAGAMRLPVSATQASR